VCYDTAEQNHWSERGRATSVANADALGRPRRSVLALGATRMKALATALIVLCFLRLGGAQTPATNGVTASGMLYLTSRSNSFSISNAVKVASGLRVGMAGEEVRKYMEHRGMGQTNVYSISLDRGRTVTYPYSLAGGTTLMLEMHCTKAPSTGLYGWSAPVLDRAFIQSQGADIITIIPTKGPQPDGAANRNQPIRVETNRTSSAAGSDR